MVFPHSLACPGGGWLCHTNAGFAAKCWRTSCGNCDQAHRSGKVSGGGGANRRGDRKRRDRLCSHAAAQICEAVHAYHKPHRVCRSKEGRRTSDGSIPALGKRASKQASTPCPSLSRWAELQWGQRKGLLRSVFSLYTPRHSWSGRTHSFRRGDQLSRQCLY